MSSSNDLTAIQPRHKIKRTGESMKRCNSGCKKLSHQRLTNFLSRSFSKHRKNTRLRTRITWQKLGVCHHWWLRTKTTTSTKLIMAMAMSYESRSMQSLLSTRSKTVGQPDLSWSCHGYVTLKRMEKLETWLKRCKSLLSASASKMGPRVAKRRRPRC